MTSCLKGCSLYSALWCFIASVNRITSFSWDGATTGALPSPGREPAIQRCLLFLLLHVLSVGLARKRLPSKQTRPGAGPERPHHPADRDGGRHQKPGSRQPSKERGRLLLRVLVPEPVDRVQRWLGSASPSGIRAVREGAPEASAGLRQGEPLPLWWLCRHLLQSTGQQRGRQLLLHGRLHWDYR